MNITIDTQNKTIEINELVSIEEFITHIQSNLVDWKDYKFKTGYSYYYYPQYPTLGPTPCQPTVIDFELFKTTSTCNNEII